MIVCPVCAKDNPLGTRFCRQCGGKLDVKLAQVMGSIETTRKDNRDVAIASAGGSALTLALFLLICVLVFRYLVVPAMPLADLPPARIGSILPKETPAAATAALPEISTKRLAWRRDNASALIGALGIDLVQIQTWQDALIATQKPDGTFPGDDPLAATALTTLALQAYPLTDAVGAASAKARAWLQPLCQDLARKQPLARSLAMTALLDAEELPDSVVTSSSTYLADGKAALWQAMAMPLFTAKTRPSELVLVRGALKGSVWSWFFELLAGKPPAVDPKVYFSETARTLKSGEDRMVWAFTAWQFAAAPNDLVETLSAWSRSAPAPIDPDTAAKCGPGAAASVAILTLTAPARVTPLWLSPR